MDARLVGDPLARVLILGLVGPIISIWGGVLLWRSHHKVLGGSLIFLGGSSALGVLASGSLLARPAAPPSGEGS